MNYTTHESRKYLEHIQDVCIFHTDYSFAPYVGVCNSKNPLRQKKPKPKPKSQNIFMDVSAVVVCFVFIGVFIPEKKTYYTGNFSNHIWFCFSQFPILHKAFPTDQHTEEEQPLFTCSAIC